MEKQAAGAACFFISVKITVVCDEDIWCNKKIVEYCPKMGYNDAVTYGGRICIP